MILRSDFDKIEKNRISKDITLLKSVVIENDNEEIISKLEKFDTLNINPSKYTELTLSEDVKNRKQEAFQLSSFSNSKFSGSITLSKDKMLFFSMPLDKGWTAIVDNKKTKIHRVNVGFSGLMLTSGTHTIELKYETPYFLLGKWISIFSFLFYGLCFWWAKKKSELNVGSE